MKKILLGLVAALFATSALADQTISLQGDNTTNGEGYINSVPFGTIDVGAKKTGEILIDGEKTGIIINKNYNKGYENGYKQGDADIVNWIKDETGMKPSKLIEKYNDVNGFVQSLIDGTAFWSDQSYLYEFDGNTHAILKAVSKYNNDIVISASLNVQSVYNDGVDSVTVTDVEVVDADSAKIEVTLSNGETHTASVWEIWFDGREAGKELVDFSGSSVGNKNVTVFLDNGKSKTVDATSIYNAGAASITPDPMDGSFADGVASVTFLQSSYDEGKASVTVTMETSENNVVATLSNNTKQSHSVQSVYDNGFNAALPDAVDAISALGKNVDELVDIQGTVDSIIALAATDQVTADNLLAFLTDLRDRGVQYGRGQSKAAVNALIK